MSAFPEGSEDGMTTQVSRVLADERRRQILEFLRQEEQPVSVGRIAQRISSIRSGGSGRSAPADGTEQLEIRLHHVHIPKLVESGLITYNERARTVTTTDHPLYAGRWGENHLSAHEAETPSVATIEHPLRREALRITNSERGPISLDELATTITSREGDDDSVEARIPELTAKLHHVHLPKLEEFGLLTYDHEEGTVSAQRSPERDHPR